jgi:hypothetical protein
VLEGEKNVQFDFTTGLEIARVGVDMSDVDKDRPAIIILIQK